MNDATDDSLGVLSDMTREDYILADLEIRRVYEVYIGVSAGDQRMRTYTQEEYIDWLSKELKLSSHQQSLMVKPETVISSAKPEFIVQQSLMVT